ncbi:hypothetical protein V1498_13330 [Peribacillus sp. SCS-26]|uniref:hypothetical protein n=1 Tax=Paraperibacillus marinus TaxID=3115295 RepID=UPI003906C354
MSERFDSLDKYYKTINNLDKTSKALFWINAALSIVVFYLEETTLLKNYLLGIFVLTTIAYFIADNYLSIFLIPNVEEKRRLHLLTNSFNVPLDNERTNKYYNNNLEPSLLKLGANVFENSLFAKRVSYEMAIKERKIIILFIFVWLLALITRTTNLELISIVAQTLFASTLIPSWLKLEVLRRKNNEIYDCLYNVFLFQNENDEQKVTARILDCFVKYESAKAYSGVKQSSKIFHRINAEVTEEWEQTKRNLGIKN